MEKRKPLKFQTGANPNSIIFLIEKGEGLMTDYQPPESVCKKV
jgi:hypothetical protein